MQEICLNAESFENETNSYANIKFARPVRNISTSDLVNKNIFEGRKD